MRLIDVVALNVERKLDNSHWHKTEYSITLETPSGSRHKAVLTEEDGEAITELFIEEYTKQKAEWEAGIGSLTITGLKAGIERGEN